MSKEPMENLENNQALKWIPTILDNGVYMELFSVKDGVRYNLKVVNIKDAANVLVTGLMDGMKKLWEE